MVLRNGSKLFMMVDLDLREYFTDQDECVENDFKACLEHASFHHSPKSLREPNISFFFYVGHSTKDFKKFLGCFEQSGGSQFLISHLKSARDENACWVLIRVS